MKAASLVLIIAAVCAPTTRGGVALAQDHPVTRSQGLDSQKYEEKQRKLKIAGWTLFGSTVVFAGAALGAGAAADNGIGAAVGVGAVGAGTLISGIAILTRRARLRRKHERSANVALTVGPGSLILIGSF